MCTYHGKSTAVQEQASALCHYNPQINHLQEIYVGYSLVSFVVRGILFLRYIYILVVGSFPQT